MTLRIYDVRGALVRTLVNDETRQAGYHAVIWDGTDSSQHSVGSGVYSCRLHAGAVRKNQKMIVMK